MSKAKIKTKNDLLIKDTTIADFAFILFICNKLVGALFEKFLAIFGMEQYYYILVIIAIYAPVLLLCAINPPKYIRFEFITGLVFIVVFFLITWIVHPEYGHYYTREIYGIWEYVLRPDNPIYIYLFIRLINDSKRILNNLKMSAWIMYPYLLFVFRRTNQVGYWVRRDMVGKIVKSSYNLSFGYEVLFFTLIFLFIALTQRKLRDWIGFAIGSIMILFAGSRGPFLCIALFLLLYSFSALKKSSKRTWYFLAGITLIPAVFLLYPYVISSMLFILEKMNITSRTIQMLLVNNITDDSGRLVIWNVAVDMIKENPFGYGAMGTRHVISEIIIQGHPHNFFLEILVDFGVFWGLIIILILLYKAMKIIFDECYLEWRGIFLIYFGMALQLLLSGTYWHSIGFSGCIAIGVCAHLSRRTELQNGKNEEKYEN